MNLFQVYHLSVLVSSLPLCQDYGHTKAYYGYSPHCVRCGNDHHSSSCPNSRDESPRCALCQENLPASYKRCSVYKNLQHRKNPNTINNNKNLIVNTNFNLKKNVLRSPIKHLHAPFPSINNLCRCNFQPILQTSKFQLHPLQLLI